MRRTANASTILLVLALFWAGTAEAYTARDAVGDLAAQVDRGPSTLGCDLCVVASEVLASAYLTSVHGNPLRFTDPTGEAVCTGGDEAACRSMYAEAVRLHNALPSFSSKAVIQGMGGEVLSIEPNGGFGSLTYMANATGLSASVGGAVLGPSSLKPLGEEDLSSLVSIFERFKPRNGVGLPGSPEGDALAKGALEGLAMQNPTQANGLLDPFALLWTNKEVLGLTGDQLGTFQELLSGHNAFLQRQYGMGYMLGVTTMGLFQVVPPAAAADAAISADVAMVMRAKALSNTEANWRLVATARREVPVSGLGRTFRTGNAQHPPSPGATRGMNRLGREAADPTVDCDELAEAIADEAKAAGERGSLLRVSPARGKELQVVEQGRPQQYVYHEVYSDGRYVYDPRLVDRPVPLGDWKRMMMRTNPGAKITVTPVPR